MQLSFNVGAMVLGLGLSKEDGYQALANACTGESTMSDFHAHVQVLVETHKISVDPEKIRRAF